ncbi:MAG: SRPBCC family protein [Niabella sp.]
MKFLKIFFIVLVFMIAAAAVLSYIAPTEQRVSRSVQVDASPAKVYGWLSSLQSIKTWAVWGSTDSSLVYEFKGKDATRGAYATWAGAPYVSGKGKITLTGLKPNQQVDYHIDFLEPIDFRADSRFLLKDDGGGITTVTWDFVMPTKRPFNIYNLFYDLKKERGADFDEGLVLLQAYFSGKGSFKTDGAVAQIEFPSTRYVAIKNEVDWVDFVHFFPRNLSVLSRYAPKDSQDVYVPTNLYFDRDEKKLKSTVAAAIAIPDYKKIKVAQPESIIHVGASKAVAIQYKGGEPEKIAAYQTIDQYVAANKLHVKKPIMEQLFKTDTTAVHRIVYLVQ